MDKLLVRMTKMMGINKEMMLTDEWEKMEMKATREGYGVGLVEEARKNERIVALTADLRNSTRTGYFAEEFPERFFDVGVAEQNLMGVAAGMALSGKIAFASSYAVFSPGRNWDQLRVSVCYSKANVKVVGGHAGISTGADGATHQGLEDIAIVRVLPEIKVVVPADYEQTRRAMSQIVADPGPVYLRVQRNKTPMMSTMMSPFAVGKGQVWKEGVDVTIFATGPIIYEAMMAAVELEGRVNVEVVNIHTIKPIDRELIVRSAKKTGLVVSVEEHQINGGLGSAVAEVLCEEGMEVRMKRVGMRDVFGESGEPEELMSKYGMDKKAIVEAVLDLVS